MEKRNEKIKKIIILPILLLIILVIVFTINLVNKNNETMNKQKEQILEKLEEEKIKVKTKTTERLGNETVYMQVTIESIEEIESVTFPNEDGTKITIIPQRPMTTIAKDLKVKINIPYDVTVKSKDGETITKTILLNGDGTKEHPIIIRTKEELQAVNEDLSAYYILGANIDLTNFEFTSIGSVEDPFVGNIDGTGYTISNLTLENEENDNIGLFSCNSGTITNMTLNNITVKGRTKTGGLVGYNSGTINNCTVRGNITGVGDATGGLVGYNDGVVTNNQTEGKVVGINQTGGLIGKTNTSIEGNIAKANVEGGENTGGLVGYVYAENKSIVLSRNVAEGKVIGTNQVGGLIGYTQIYESTNGTYIIYVQESYATSNVEAEEGNIGGLIGYIAANDYGEYDYGYTSKHAYAIVQNSFTTGSVKGGYNVGGLVGYLYRYSVVPPGNKYAYKHTANIEITNTYAIGEVVAEEVVGGLIGNTASSGGGSTTVINSYWTPETTKQENSVLGSKNIIPYMLHQTGYEEWDFENVWKIEEGHTIAYLRDVKKPDSVNKENIDYEDFEVVGDGTEENPYIIKTPVQLQKISEKLASYYKIGANIDLTNFEFIPIGSAEDPFVGNIDGTGYTISNLNIETEENDNIGLFSCNSGTITNMTLNNITIKGRTNTGGLVGYNAGTIDNCTVRGNTTGVGDSTGGLVGYNDGIVSECKVNSQVTGLSNNTGGLIGYNVGTVTNNITEGIVIGTINNTGGLIGQTASGISGNISKANVEGQDNTGGLVGYVYAENRNIVLSENGAEGKVVGGYNVGGLIGYTQVYESTNGTYIIYVQESYAASNVEAEGGNIGGLIGYIAANDYGEYDYGYTSKHAYVIIQNSLATGSVKGGYNVGGLVGYLYRYSVVPSGNKYAYKHTANIEITNTYAIGEVVGEEVVGGLVGNTASTNRGSTTIANSYWTPETTKQLYSAAGNKNFISHMLHETGYEGWDFENVWKIEEGQTLAYLRDVKKPDSVNKDYMNYEDVQLAGNGTKENPYLITNVQELKKIAENLTAHYRLEKNIDLSNEGRWVPLGTQEEAFTGSFDGNGYTISNMQIDSKNNFQGGASFEGLFGNIYKATIQNLTLKDYNISTSGTYVGGLVGYSLDSNITNVMAIGNIYYKEASGYIGGLVGAFEASEVSLCTISRCYTEGNINYLNRENTVKDYGGVIGGICGELAGDIYITAGGIQLNRYGRIENSYSTTNIVGNSVIGGIVGYLGGRNNATGYGAIYTSYALGKIEGETYTGGLIGYAWDDTCLATNLYWTKELSTQQEGVLGTAKTVSALTRKATYSSWNFTNIWTIEEGNTFPYLQGGEVPDAINKILSEYPIMEGQGTKEAPYIITSVEQLAKVKEDLKAYYKLANDIDLSQISNWTPIGTVEEPFTGNFDGNGYTISNMKINTEDSFQGLFGNIYKATIQNLTIKDYNIKTSGVYVGGLAGYSIDSNITNITAIGDIYYKEESSYIGGLIGVFESDEAGVHTISKCYTEGNINYLNKENTIKDYGVAIGGICGQLAGDIYTNSAGNQYKRYARIENSYSTTNIIGNNVLGGLVGYLGGRNGLTGYGSITASYAIGKVEGESYTGGLIGYAWDETCLVTNAYWAKELSNQQEGVLGTAKTVSGLTKQSTYNWNFTNIWAIEEGSTFAYLQGKPVPDIIRQIVENYPIMEGQGTENEPYIITSAEQLTKVKEDVKVYYKLANDIDLSQIQNWTPIGTKEEPFTGNFDGNGHTISNMKINIQDGYQGLFGYVYKATIKNLEIKDYDIIANGEAIGGLAGGIVSSHITNIKVNGNIRYGEESLYIGGLTGYFESADNYSYDIKNCCSAGEIRYYNNEGTSYGQSVGGLIGSFSSGVSERYVNIYDSYSTTNVTGNNTVGGLIGNIRRI